MKPLFYLLFLVIFTACSFKTTSVYDDVYQAGPDTITYILQTPEYDLFDNWYIPWYYDPYFDYRPSYFDLNWWGYRYYWGYPYYHSYWFPYWYQPYHSWNHHLNDWSSDGYYGHRIDRTGAGQTPNNYDKPKTYETKPTYYKPKSEPIKSDKFYKPARTSDYQPKQSYRPSYQQQPKSYNQPSRSSYQPSRLYNPTPKQPSTPSRPSSSTPSRSSGIRK